jgi:hypothetical protein
MQQQLVVRLPKTARREQRRLIAIVRECSRLAYQPADDVPVIDEMLVLATQPRQHQYRLLGVTHVDVLGAHPDLHPFADQTRRHRIGVLEHADRAARRHLHRQPLQRLQTPRRQRPQHRQFLGKTLLPGRVLSGHDALHERRVLFACGEVPTATHQQRLLQSTLELSVRLFAIAVLVATVWVRRLCLHPVVVHQALIVPGEAFRIAILIHGQRHAIRAMPPGHAAQGPDRVLKAFAQTGEALRKAQSHVLPVRIRQHKMVRQVRERLPRDRHAQVGQVREVRGRQPARLVHLREEHFLVRTRQRTPTLHPPLHRPQHFVAVLPRITLLQERQQRVRLQLRRPFQLSLHLRPHRRQRVHARPPRACLPPLSWHFPLPVLPCRLPIHVRLQRRFLQ